MARKHRISEFARRQVRERAGERCEYCLPHQEDGNLTFEADHVVAEKHGGSTTLDNLAWSCFTCNHYKGTDLSSVDPSTTRTVPLFNPRKQQWSRHFRLNGGRIEGITASGRATERLLRFNRDERIAVRLNLIALGRYPRE
jgi:5-methylcytosine-specific restriction endonuclease McrA